MKHKHIHIYFNEAAKDHAMELRRLIAEEFPDLRLGSVHDDPVGPHPMGSYLVLLPEDREDEVRSFLEKNHGDLSILIHPLSGDDAIDHKDENIDWIGKPVALDHSAFHP